MSANPRRRLPAFGRELAELRRSGRRPADFVMVYIDRWPTSRGPFVVPTLCVPQGVPACALDWTLIRGLDVHVLSWSGQRLAAAVDAILRAGVRTLLVCNFSVGHGEQWALDIDARGPADATLDDSWRAAA